ncbi:MAG: glycosyltransferase, partial [Hyphomicrobium sp.]
MVAFPIEIMAAEARPLTPLVVRHQHALLPTDATIAAELEAELGGDVFGGDVHSDDGLVDGVRQDVAIDRLRHFCPDLSAARRLVWWQAFAIAAAFALLGAGLALAPGLTVATVFALGTLPSLAFLALRLAAMRQLLEPAQAVRPTGAAACETVIAPSDGAPDTPHYTVLVPLYREAPVVPQLVAALEALDYPPARLDVMLIVEHDDAATRDAIRRSAPPSHMRVVVVPPGLPRTKPRALNHALSFAGGEFVVVFDAEDQPEPDQLRKALAVFRSSPANLGCLQARLNVYNPAASWLTRQFAIEYMALFDGILPALERYRLPVMLGGTSNHFPRAVLESVHGWDPYNVTEDADLGLRLARRGYHVGVLASTTWEEAPEAYGVWLGQRTRWLKGWMQTYLVHMRQPLRLWRELGARRFLAFNLLTGGVVLSALVHPWIYIALTWDVAAGQAFAVREGVLGSAVWWFAAFNLLASYGAAIALGAVA